MLTLGNVKKTSGKNMRNIKFENRSLLLTQLFFKGMKSRTSLAKELRLTPASITQTIGAMIDEGIVLATDKYEPTKGLGRRQQFIDIRYENLYAVGVTITNTHARICISDLRFKHLYDDVCELDEASTPRYAQLVCDRIAFGLYKSSIQKTEVVGIGVSIRGNVDSDRGISEDSFGLLPRHTRIAEDMQQLIGIPVTVDNHIRSLMICEAIYSRCYMENTLFIKYGPGISSAITVDGRLYTGGHHLAGEIGHVVVERKGAICRCGKQGCLETLASFRAMRARLAGYECESLGQLLDLFEQGNPRAVTVVEESLRHLLLAISNMATLFDPKDIILYGELFESRPFLDHLKDIQAAETPELTQRLHISAHNALLDDFMACALAIHGFLESGEIGAPVNLAKVRVLSSP
jgi:predicted NBD/HSP70 family sugar kinase